MTPPEDNQAHSNTPDFMKSGFALKAVRFVEFLSWNAFRRHDRLELSGQCRKIFLEGLIENVVVDIIVAMNQLVAHADDGFPRDD